MTSNPPKPRCEGRSGAAELAQESGFPVPTRVLLYSSTSRDNPGGVHAVYTRLATSLRQRGHAVTEGWSAPGDGGGDNELIQPLPRLTNRSGSVTARQAGRVVFALGRLARGLARCRPDIVNIHFVRHDAIYFLLLRPWFRYKVVLTGHGSDIMAPQKHNARLLPHLFPRADAVTVVNTRLAERVRACPGVDERRVHVIPNGVDFEYWGRRSVTPLRNGRAPVVITVGRLEQIKGHDVLIRAMAVLRQRIPEASLVIVGDGKSRAELEQLAVEQGVHRATTFAGALGSTDVRNLLHRADVFALPSRSEGMPLALLQAMAAGVPPVATWVGGVTDVIDGASGLLVPPDEPVALADALARIADNVKLAHELSAGARSRASAFSNTAVDEGYSRLFAGLVKRS